MRALGSPVWAQRIPCSSPTKRMCSLIAFASASRFRLASTTSCSASATSNWWCPGRCAERPIRCVDLIQHRNLTIEVRVRREGVRFEILYGDGDLRRVGPQPTEQIDRALVCTIRELNGCIVGLHAIKLFCRYLRKGSPVCVEALSRSLIAVVNTKTTVDRSGPGGSRP